MQSNWTGDDRYTLTVTFQIGTDLDFAQVLVQNRVSAAIAQLPMAVQQQGIVTKKKETSPLQIITLASKDDRYSALLLSSCATNSRGCREWATWWSSESANTACESGLIPASLISAGSSRRMSSPQFNSKTLMSPPVSSVCRLRRLGRIFS